MNKLNYVVRNSDGSPAKLNIFSILVVVTALVEVWKPFIPAEWMPYLLAVVASITVIANYVTAAKG